MRLTMVETYKALVATAGAGAERVYQMCPIHKSLWLKEEQRPRKAGIGLNLSENNQRFQFIWIFLVSNVCISLAEKRHHLFST